LIYELGSRTLDFLIDSRLGHHHAARRRHRRRRRHRSHAEEFRSASWIKLNLTKLN